ncbi:hypothetical protein FG386_003329 [Cryptosporidium ryanae]|uniref:uncharacterized protein n=1 Tax=Cryptosporidium ryanae TaxID=515981 RepID=UPI00351A29F6|nr:hypothetical protein FG386_003329 [Cryptosporidium ryanae]
MSEESDQFTVTEITTETCSNGSKPKDSTFWILESKKEISAAEDVYYGLREGLRANCADKNNCQVEERLKAIIPGRSGDSVLDLQFYNNTETPQNIKEESQADEITRIIEKSRELGKENIQKVEGIDVVFSGFGGKPFVFLDKNNYNVKTDNLKNELTLDKRVKASEEMDQLLLSTLKSLVEVDRLNNNVNSNIDIRFNPDSNINKSLGEMKEMLTSILLKSFNASE